MNVGRIIIIYVISLEADSSQNTYSSMLPLYSLSLILHIHHNLYQSSYIALHEANHTVSFLSKIINRSTPEEV